MVIVNKVTFIEKSKNSEFPCLSSYGKKIKVCKVSRKFIQ